MATEAWLEAARNYNRMNDRARAEYWKQLTPEQQDALRDALASSRSNVLASPVRTDPASAPVRRGCGGPLTAGCVGMILGSIITIGLEIAALMMGVQAVGDALDNLSGGSNSSTASGSNQPTVTVEPGDNVMSTNDQLLSYCGTAREFNDSSVASACANERRNQQLREEMAKRSGN